MQHKQLLEMLYRQAPLGLAMFDLDLRYVQVSEALARMNQTSIESHIGKHLLEIYPAGSVLEPIYRRVLETGISVDEFEMQDELGTLAETRLSSTRHFRGQFYPIKDPGGGIIGLSTIWQDITEAKFAEANQRLLNMELIHRTKNLLAVVQGVASRSLVGEQTLEHARQSLLDRLNAVARACTSLTETSWQGVSLERIIALECEEHRGAVSYDGPSMLLNAGAAQSFALMVHELATNATKYGALSVPEGRVTIRWHIEDGEDGARLRLRWMESNGPKVQKPTRRGFGNTLLQRIMSDGNAYRAKADFASSGLIYDLDVAPEAIAALSTSQGQFVAREAKVA